MNSEEAKRLKVSVIIPVYNTAPYLEKAVTSIFNQTLTELEIIAINDGSTDNSLEILTELQLVDARLQIYSQQNQGLSVTRNVGLSKAKGEFIYFFDSDDFLRKDALEECYQRASAGKCDLVCFDAVIMDDPHSERSLNLPYQRKGVLAVNQDYSGAEALRLLQDKGKFSSSVCLCFISTTYLRNIRLQFYPGILHEDQLFTCLLYIQASCIQYIPADYFHRRMRAQSIMTSPVSMRNINGCLIVCRELKSFQRQHPELSSFQQKLIRQQITMLVHIMASSSLSFPFAKRMKVLCTLVSKHTAALRLTSVILLFSPALKLKKRRY